MTVKKKKDGNARIVIRGTKNFIHFSHFSFRFDLLSYVRVEVYEFVKEKVFGEEKNFSEVTA